MAEPFEKDTNKKSSVLVKMLAGAVIVAAVATLGLIGYKFISYKETGGVQTYSNTSQVAISSPPTGVQLELSESVLVEAAAIGTKPFASMELWINGELLGVQIAPGGEKHPFSTFFSWLPNKPGAYSLAAAAIDIDGNKEMSAPVTVYVTQTETEIELVSSNSPSVLPASSGGGYTPPSGPGSSESAGPANIWTGSTGNWLTSLLAKVEPAAPELVVNAGKCAASLQIHDQSDNEEGFVVYRQVGISPTWVKVATLSSQSDLDWIVYQDEGIYGEVYYYVAAFNSQGESKSDFAFVSIDPSDCDSENTEVAVGKLNMALNVPNLVADWVYCYLSTDGINWARWPVTGFLTPEEGLFSAEIVALSLTGDQQNIPTMDLLMECWGWQGGEIKPIGKLTATDLLPQLNDPKTVVGEGMSGEITLIPGPGYYNNDSFFDVEFEIDGAKNAILTGKLKPISPEIPRVYLSYSTDFDTCMQHVGSDGNKLANCFSYLGNNEEETKTQSFLLWDFDFFEPNCVGGNNEECKTYWELLGLAEENGGQVGFTIISMKDGKKTVWNVTKPNQTMFVVPPFPCLGGNEFSVRMWYRPGNKGVSEAASPDNQISEIGGFEISPPEVFYGPYSNWVSIPCQFSMTGALTAIEKIQYLDVTFESVEFLELDDDDMGFQEVELYGFFRVDAPSMGHWADQFELFWLDSSRNLNLAYWEVDTVGNSGTGGLQVFGNGSYDLSNTYFCQSSSKYNCNESQSSAWKTGNNTIRVFVKDGDVLKIDVMLIDYDEASANDTVCIDTILTPSKSLSQWSNIDGSYTMSGPIGGSGGCKVNVTVSPVGGPVPYSSP